MLPFPTGVSEFRVGNRSSAIPVSSSQRSESFEDEADPQLHPIVPVGNFFPLNDDQPDGD